MGMNKRLRSAVLVTMLGSSAIVGVSGCDNDEAINYQAEDTKDNKLNKDKSIDYSKIDVIDNFSSINSGVEGKTDFDYKPFANYLTQKQGMLPSDIYTYKDVKNLVGVQPLNDEVEGKSSVLYKDNKLYLYDLQLNLKDNAVKTSDKGSKETKEDSSSTDNDKVFTEARKAMTSYLDSLSVDIANFLVKQDTKGKENEELTLQDFKTDSVGNKYIVVKDTYVYYTITYTLDDEGEGKPVGVFQVSSSKHFKANQKATTAKNKENVAHDHDGDGVADHDASEHNDEVHGKTKEFEDVE